MPHPERGRPGVAERFVSPCVPPEGRLRELLTILVEECAEVQQRATKALRFGLDEVQPGQPHSNAVRLSHEVGDLFEVVGMLVDMGAMYSGRIGDGRANKRRQLAKYMQHQEVPDADPV